MLENEFFDAARVRSDEALVDRQGRVMHVSIALSPDGEVAGHTQLSFPEAGCPDVFQWDTLVLKAHRGHGLGLSLKVHAMEVSEDLFEDRKYIYTYYAASTDDRGQRIAGLRHVANCGDYIRDI